MQKLPVQFIFEVLPMVPCKSNQTFWDQLFDLLQETKIAAPSLLLGTVLIFSLSFDNQYSTAIDLSILLFSLFPVAILNLYGMLHARYTKAGFAKRFPLIAVFGLPGGILLALTFTTPAHALFFNDAETWSSTAFNQGGGTDIQNAIKFVFNIFRFLMVASILATIASVGYGLATDRDLATIARVPAGFAAIFVIGDIFSSLLTKGAT